MIEKIKNLLYIITAGISFAMTNTAFGQTLSEGAMDPDGGSILKDASTSDGTNSITALLVFIKSLLFNLLWIVVVAAFIYIGYLFVTARGKPEEFKKAWMHVIYVIVGIAIVSAAWGIVSLVAGIDL